MGMSKICQQRRLVTSSLTQLVTSLHDTVIVHYQKSGRVFAAVSWHHILVGICKLFHQYLGTFAGGEIPGVDLSVSASEIFLRQRQAQSRQEG